MDGSVSLPILVGELMGWLESPEMQFVLFAFGMGMVGFGVYGYSHGRFSRSELNIFLIEGSA